MLMAAELMEFCSTNGDWKKENLLEASQLSYW